MNSDGAPLEPIATDKPPQRWLEVSRLLAEAGYPQGLPPGLTLSPREEAEVYAWACARERAFEIVALRALQDAEVARQGQARAEQQASAAQAERDAARWARDAALCREPVDPEVVTKTLAERFKQAGEPHVGWITRDGLTQIPEVLFQELQFPLGVAWVRVKEDTYGFVTLRALRAAEDAYLGGGDAGLDDGEVP